jgi:hypothetical protein
VKLPPESSSSWVHIAFAAFTWASLKAWSEFTQLPQADQAKLGELAMSLRSSADALLKEARETQDVQMFGRPEAQAKQNAWLTLLKRTAAETLSTVVNKLGQGSEDHPAVRQFLPKLLTGLTSLNIADRPKEAALAANRLDKIDGTFSDKADLVKRLSDASAGAKAAIEANADAKGAWGKERSEEILAKAQLRLSLEKTHRLLGAQFPGQREFVESFFLKGSKPSEGGDAAEEPADEKPTEP